MGAESLNPYGMALQGLGVVGSLVSGIKQAKAAKDISRKAQSTMSGQVAEERRIGEEFNKALAGRTAYKADLSLYQEGLKTAELQARRAGVAPLAGQVYAEQQIARGAADTARRIQQTGGGSSQQLAALMGAGEATAQSLAGLGAQSMQQQQLMAQQAQGNLAQQQMQYANIAQQAGLQEYQSQQDLIQQRAEARRATDLGVLQTQRENLQTQLALDKGVSDAINIGAIGGVSRLLGATGAGIVQAGMQKNNLLMMQNMLANRAAAGGGVTTTPTANPQDEYFTALMR